MPLMHWVFPRVTWRPGALRRLFQMEVDDVLQSGNVLLTADALQD